MDAALSQGPASDARALSRWYRGQDVISEGRAGICAVVDSHRKDLVRRFEARDRFLHDRQRDYQSKDAHAERPGLYRLPATRSWQDYRGAILGAAAGWSAGLGADEVGGTETGA